MLNTQNIPNKFKFSIERKLISEKMKKKTVLTVLTALVKGNVKSRNSILGFTENPTFFTATLKDFHSEGALTVYLLLADKETNKKTQQQKTCDP